MTTTDPIHCRRPDGLLKKSWRKRQEALVRARLQGGAARAYLCPSCGQYHITTTAERR